MASAPPVRSLAGVRFDPVAKRYRLRNGRFLSRQGQLRVLEDQIEATGADMRSLAEQLQSGRINLASWQLQMEGKVKSLHLLSAAIEHGGFAQMAPSDLGWLANQVKAQYRFLAEFARQIERGTQPLDGRFLQRVALYANAGRGTQREATRRLGRLAGHTEERNLLHARDHCHAKGKVPGCSEEAARGWVPIGTLPPVGSRRCATNCRCVIETRDGRAA